MSCGGSEVESHDSNSTGGSSFVVSDTEELLTLEQRATVDSELRHIREARADITAISITYLWGLPQARVHARVMSKASSASSAEWNTSFNDVLRHPVVFCDLPTRSRGTCAACNRPRWLYSQLVLPDTSILCLGRTCATRALVAHTLLQAQAACMQMLGDTPIGHLQVFENKAVRALGAVMDAADDAAEMTYDAYVSSTDRITRNVMSARKSLGFATPL
jgi:hypothetical protein